MIRNLFVILIVVSVLATAVIFVAVWHLTRAFMDDVT